MQIVKLNLIPGGVLPVCFASQHDTGRVIRFMLFEGENVFTLSGAESIELRLKKPDGSELVESVTNTGADYVDVVTTADTCDTAGASVGEIVITDGGDVLGSGNFGLFVESDAFEGGGIVTQTATGPIATFETNIETAFVSLKSDINPVQSGSGTPSPQNVRPISGFSALNVTRTGKNKLPNTYTTQTINGVTFTVNDDGSVKVNGTASTTALFTLAILGDILTDGQSVYINGNASDNKAFLQLQTSQYGGVANVGSDYNLVYSTSGEAQILVIRVNSGQTANNITINPMIRLPNTSADFEPYKGSKYQSYFSGLANGTYGVVDLGTLNWQYGSSYNGVFYDNSKFTKNNPSGLLCDYPFKGGYNVMTDKSCGYIFINRIAIKDDSFNGDVQAFAQAMSGKYMIYPLATPTTPTITQTDLDMLISKFNADLVTVIFGQTVYGGVCDVTNGKLTITHGIVDLGTLNWTYKTSGSQLAPYFYTDFSGIKFRGNPTVTKYDFLCSIYESVRRDVSTFVDGKMCADGSVTEVTQIQIKDSRYTDAILFKTAMSGVMFCYELATPIEITTTPENLTAIVGQNNVYSDTNGDTEVEYYIEV